MLWCKMVSPKVINFVGKQKVKNLYNFDAITEER
jgi:hypothetical protein